MKSENPSPRKTGAGRGKSSVGIPHLPMEWMDPMSWRLPSGKALAEFALQTGFLAPLMMRAPKSQEETGGIGCGDDIRCGEPPGDQGTG